MQYWLSILCTSILLTFGCSREQAPPTPLPAQVNTAPALEPQASSDPASILELGEHYYQRSCASCHDSGAGGAPLLGDAAIWKSRIDQGMETLVNHAIEGFKSSACVMPPRGGDASMQIDAVALAVRYMVEKGLPPEAQAGPESKTK
jgi:cytochrome c5